MNEAVKPVNTLASEAEVRAREARRNRRRFIKATGAMVLAAPVIESITGSKLVTVSAQAQTQGFQGFDGAFTGGIDPLAG